MEHVRAMAMPVRLAAAAALVLAVVTLLSACGGRSTVTLAVTTTGNGAGTVLSNPTGIACGDACSAPFQAGQVVTLSAVPAPGSELAGWSGCDAASGPTCTVELAASRSVTATFVTGSISGTVVYPGDVVGPSATPLAPPPAVDRPLAHDGAELIPGEVLVRFAPDTLRAASTLQAAGASVTLSRPVGGGALYLYRATGVGSERTLEVAAALRSRPDVLDATPNWVVRAFKAPDDAFYAFQWHYERINLEAAWDVEDGTGNDVVIAVLDTGVVEHPDLQASLLPGFDFVEGDADPFDPGGNAAFHGTHVAGTVAAVTDNGIGVAGVSWGASVLPVRVLDGSGVGTLDTILDGVAWAAGLPSAAPNANPARIVNLSLGGTVAGGCPALAEAVFADAVAAGVTIVAAAGNTNVDAANTFPAHCPSVFTVGATGPLDTRAPYSNFGLTVDVMAPGGDLARTLTVGTQTVPAGVLSTTAVQGSSPPEPTYGFYQGTSMASPHVAGVMALMLSADPSLTPADLTQRLRETARALDATACNRPSGSACGAGLIDAAAALADDPGDAPPPPRPPDTTPLPVPTYVVAFHCIAIGSDPCADIDFDRTGTAEIDTDANKVPYTVTGLSSGRYVVVAWQDLDQNLVVEDGDPVGVHPDVVLAPGEARTGIALVMEPYVPLGSTDADAATPVHERALDALERWSARRR